MLYPYVIEQHAELLPFLWTQRAALAGTGTTAFGDLSRFDLRLQGNQDGLLLAGRAAGSILERTWAEPDRGIWFGRATLALAAGDLVQFADLAIEPDARSPLVSALGFAASGAAANALVFLAASEDLPLRQIASRGHRALRVAHGLAPLISDSDPSVHGPAIEAAGLARSVDAAAVSALHNATRSGGFGPYCALWLISRDPKYLDVMLEAPDVDVALACLATRLAPPSWLASWIAANRDHSPELAIALTSALGLVEHLGWLGEIVDEPQYSAQAAQALRLVAGAPELVVEAEQDESSTPTSPGRALWGWLQANAGRFDREERYLAGVPITPKTIYAQLCRGTQSLRLHAAFEAANANPQEPIMNIQGPSYRQLSWLRTSGLGMHH